MDQGFINLFYVFGGIIAFVLFIVIMRAVFNIPTLVDYQRKQYEMLKLMAEKLGVDEQEILRVHNTEDYKAKLARIRRQELENEKISSN